MKKLLFLVVIITTGLLLTACQSPEEDSKAIADNRKAEGANPDESFVDELIRSETLPEARAYAGKATREEMFCLSDCPVCNSPGDMAVHLLPSGDATVEHVGPCMKYGQNGCSTDGDQCQWSISGRYAASSGKITVFTCNNGQYEAGGQASFDEQSSSGSVNCSDKGETAMMLDWSGLQRVK